MTRLWGGTFQSLGGWVALELASELASGAGMEAAAADLGKKMGKSPTRDGHLSLLIWQEWSRK